MVEPSRPGVRRCMRCGWLFVSPDAERIRRCADCKRGEDEYVPPTARSPQLDGLVGYNLRDN